MSRNNFVSNFGKKKSLQKLNFSKIYLGLGLGLAMAGHRYLMAVCQKLPGG